MNETFIFFIRVFFAEIEAVFIKTEMHNKFNINFFRIVFLAETKAIFTKTEINNGWNINFLLNNFKSIQHPHSCDPFISWSDMKLCYHISFNVHHIFKFIWMNFQLRNKKKLHEFSKCERCGTCITSFHQILQSKENGHWIITSLYKLFSYVNLYINLKFYKFKVLVSIVFDHNWYIPNCLMY